ncbi:predicted protein [Postia placenta Mad-698-R]|uniref:Uncharacterized protein n=2 Tax=Rhodonia placenta TaxID=104341 RepID=A0A1X6MWW9_9APHY|nr:hypothetical protein POSPLADRAFT_1145921 [Postia placenta MAD-698-R-SB12]EED85000.1 predicted protein [Postia placenta Mad-698-R]KAF9809159.1 hypothetical protein IEO21_07532 [Postia placenta]OSX60851.1 hypothetical protein POSPLADRAFT_1145921 [Postia placenta MAD-698-R-SB12]
MARRLPHSEECEKGRGRPRVSGSIPPFSKALMVVPRHWHGLVCRLSGRLNKTHRADDAEARIMDVLRQFRTACETARTTEEVRLYKLCLDAAQREISRAGRGQPARGR